MDETRALIEQKTPSSEGEVLSLSRDELSLAKVHLRKAVFDWEDSSLADDSR
jgi:hypothetical protein